MYTIFYLSIFVILVIGCFGSVSLGEFFRFIKSYVLLSFILGSVIRLFDYINPALTASYCYALSSIIVVSAIILYGFFALLAD